MTANQNTSRDMTIYKSYNAVTIDYIMLSY